MTHRPELDDVAARLDRRARQAARAIAWERLWPVLAAASTVVVVFVAVSFLGLWLFAPRPVRIAGVLAFAAAFALALWPLARWRWPSRAQSLTRLDRDSGLAHRPATSFDDTLANPASDPATAALWRLHRARAQAAIAKLKPAAPSPRLKDRDVYALRGLAAVALVAAAFIAGPEKYARVLAAFDWRDAGPLSASSRLDAWIDPPAYTGRPPIVLGAVVADGPIAAPVGSVVVVRSTGSGGAGVSAGAGLEPQPMPAAKPGADDEKRFTLRADARLDLTRFGASVARYDLTAIPDKPPTIALVGDPKVNARGSLTLTYKIDDDYGVVGAEATFAKPAAAGASHALVDPPKMTLSLPAAPGGLGQGESTADLSESPWAGARVVMTLVARDEGENEGRGAPTPMTLPQRTFVKPLARALVEQRRNLVLTPETRGRVALAFDALMIAPEAFETPAAVYLGLRTIRTRLGHAKSDADLLDVADFIWAMALRIEDGGVSEAERDLRAAEQALREAMEHGASDDELRQKMADMRQAMDKFLNELAQQAQNDPDAQQQAEGQQNSRAISQRDLQAMLDKMETMAKNGDRAQAQAMLDQMQQMLENLRTAKRSPRADAQARAMNRALDELDQMTRDEQALRDDTFRQGQNSEQSDRGPQGRRQQGQRQQGRNGQGDQGQDAQSLQRRQKALRDRLDAMRDAMKQFGMDGDKALGDAGEGMQGAEQDLGQQDEGQAVDDQGRAIDGLRRGAQSLAQQMQQGQGEQAGGEGAQPGEPNGPLREGRNGGDPDPLGRERHDRRDDYRAQYDPMGQPAAQRAQRVLEELRKRLSDPARAREELDYLERLLKP